MKKFNVLLYEDMHEEGKTILKEKADIIIAERLDEPYLVDHVRDIDGIIVRANRRISRKVMESGPKLKVVGRHGVGVEKIDLEAATEKGI